MFVIRKNIYALCIILRILKYVPPIQTHTPNMVSRREAKRLGFHIDPVLQYKYISPGITSIIKDPKSDPLSPITSSTLAAKQDTVHVAIRTLTAVLGVKEDKNPYTSRSLNEWKWSC